MPIQRLLNQLLAFLNFYQYTKNQFISSVDFWDKKSWSDWPQSILTMPTPQNFQYLICVNLYRYVKNQLIPSVHSRNIFNFRARDEFGHIYFWPSQKSFDQRLIFVSLHVQKIKLFHWFVLEIWLIKKSCNLIGWEHFGLYLTNKHFPKYGICAGTRQII